jgi:hypothetical protein
VVFTVSAAVLVIGSVIVGALARGEVHGRTIAREASEPQSSPATMREIGEAA